MTEYRTWEEILMERFTSDWEEAIGYLDVALEEYQEDGDVPFFLLGLQNVVEARGGISEIAKQLRIEPKILSDMLSSEEAPRIDLLSAVLTALGCRLSIKPLKEASSALPCADENYLITPKEDPDSNLEVATESSDPR